MIGNKLSTQNWYYLHLLGTIKSSGVAQMINLLYFVAYFHCFLTIYKNWLDSCLIHEKMPIQMRFVTRFKQSFVQNKCLASPLFAVMHCYLVLCAEQYYLRSCGWIFWREAAVFSPPRRSSFCFLVFLLFLFLLFVYFQ